jgi:zinc transport system substrate-binding protein
MVTVSILPQKYFVEKIAGDAVTVSVMVAPGSNPAIYEPRPGQMNALAHSRIYFAIGVPFERVWLKKMAALNPKMQIVYTDGSIEKRAMAVHHHEEQENGQGKTIASHGHARHGQGLDPHIWLSPALVKTQARIIKDALVRIDPGHEKVYNKGFEAFEAELDQLDAEIREIFGHKGRGNEFLVFHPSWGYFAAAYGLKQVPIEIEGKEPSAAEMARLIQYARSKGIRVIFVQPQFSTKRAEAIAREIGARILIADPLHEHWMQNLREVARKFAAALR